MVKISFIRQVSRALKPTEIKGLRYAPEYLPDTVQISRKSALSEFKNYLEGWRIHGEDFVPQSANPESTFMEYFNFKKKICKPQPARKLGGFSVPARPAPPKVVVKGETPESPIVSLLSFKNFMQFNSQHATKEEYYEVIDEISRLMPEYVARKYKGLRPEIVERSGDIFRWRSYLDVEKKVDDRLVQTRFFDAQKKEEALNEYVEFVENLTGKKVLVGSPTRIHIAVDELGLLNDPNSYKDVDYILFGHGKGSSLITDIENSDTWHFSDNNVSIWKFIEENVPKGKRVLVGCCEKDKFWRADGTIPEERKALAEMYDKSGNYMFGIGNTVCCSFGEDQPAKVCESGVRHIIGHTKIEKYKGLPDTFINSTYGNTKTIYYDL